MTTTFPTVYVSPSSYYPIREVTLAPAGAKVHVVGVINWLRYKVLPATAVNQRLVSLTARHPGARTVHVSAGVFLRIQSQARKR